MAYAEIGPWPDGKIGRKNILYSHEEDFMRKNCLRRTAALHAAAMAAILTCAGACQRAEKGTHQEGNKCVLNDVPAAGTAAPAPAGAR